MNVSLRLSAGNLLLARLPDREAQQLGPDLERVELIKGEKLATPASAATHVYFPTSGIASVIAVSPKGKVAEAGLIGAEGFLPVAAAAGPVGRFGDITIQLAGEACRMPLDTFSHHVAECPVLQQLLLRAIIGFTAQLAETALANAVHSVEERLARWLLLCHDRVKGDEIALTHEFIALMLSVRRPSVTSSLHLLEGRGLIRAERGLITMRNRAAMETFAIDTYGRADEEYHRLMALPLEGDVSEQAGRLRG
ncbi:Crp/Fnr family transcriptional regulator [Rhizobium sp. SAFR-030]|uniref:Crp/Fnr family transcriptional regulator n=1 Tax=Rhizobium sp. SAFR-030 TaxID=3387277 RepID=UPI003F8228C8